MSLHKLVFINAKKIDCSLLELQPSVHMTTLPVYGCNPSVDSYPSNCTHLHGTTASHISMLAFVLLAASKSASPCKPAGGLTAIIKWKRNALPAYDIIVNLLNVNHFIEKRTLIKKHITFLGKPSEG